MHEQAGQFRQQMLQREVEIESEADRGMMEVLRADDACIHAAREHEDMRSCHEHKHEGMERVRQEAESQHQALRAQMEPMRGARQSEHEAPSQQNQSSQP